MDELDIFSAALELGTLEERAKYLDQACGDNAALRQRIEALLQSSAEASRFLEAPAPGIEGAATLDRVILEQPGSQIGRYKLLQEIGQGGMGIVYMAEQHEPVRRMVALKIIKPGMDSRQVIARFDAERQALSLMDHPNIARVLDAGTTNSGRPYFVMELVHGIPVTQFCDEQHLTARERLELFIPICHAVQHAHQKGIIHRDIKPSNILVALYDGQPVPKVIDFGVAKATGGQLTEMTIFTGLGQIVGTLEYMSPEQAQRNQLDIDTRSDVYSLGVVLYELLAGDTPFDRQRLRAAALDELLWIIREEEPPKPSLKLSHSDTLPSVAANRKIEPAKLSALVRGELDWIVMKALEKDRTRRYETANGLANDVRRYLDDEPVTACPPSAAYRFRKFARRNKAVMVTTALVTAALVLGLLGTSWQAIRATVAERQAQANEQSALTSAASEAQQRQKAEAAEKTAAEEAAVAKAVNQFLQEDLLGLAGAEEQLSAKMKPDPNLTLSTLLDRALSKVDERFADQPRVRAEVQAALAQAFYSIGRYDNAVKLLEQVRQYRQTAFGLDHRRTLDAMSELVCAYHAQSEYAAAQALGMQVVELRRRLLGPEHPDTLSSMHDLAALYLDQGNYTDAERQVQAVLEVQRRVLGPEHRQTLSSMNTEAAIYLAQAKYAAAESLFKQLLEVNRRVLSPEHPDSIESLHNLASLYVSQKRDNEAETLLQEALEIERRVLGPEHPDMLNSVLQLARVYRVQAKYAEAESLLTQTLEIDRRVLGNEHLSTLRVMHELAMAYSDQGKFSEARQLLDQTLEIQRRVLGPEHPDTRSSVNDLATLLIWMGQFAEAEPLLLQSLDYERRVRGPEHPDTVTVIHNLGALYIRQARYAEAEPLLAQALDISRRLRGPEHPDTLAAVNNLAELYLQLQRYAEAEPLLTESLDIARRTLGLEHPDTLWSMNNLGRLYAKQGKFAEAESLLAQALELLRRVLGPEHPNTLASTNSLAALYCAENKNQEAETLLVQVLDVRRRVLGPEHPDTLLSMSNLASTYRNLSKYDQAEPLLSALLAIQRRTRAQDDPETANTASRLADTLMSMGRSEEAEPLLRENVAFQENKLPEGWGRWYAKSSLGECLSVEGKSAEAEPLLLDGYQGLQARNQALPPPMRSQVLAKALERLISHYESISRPEEVARWKAELQQLQSAVEQ